MASATQVKESERASLAYHIALTYIGLEALEEAKILWESVSPTRLERTAPAWLRTALRLVGYKRKQAHDLTRAYLRLQRAIYTGTTVRAPGERAQRVPVAELRSAFEERVLEHVPEAEVPAPVIADDVAESVVIETVDGIEEELDRLDREAQDEAGNALRTLGWHNLDKLLDQAFEPDEAHAKVSSRQAAAVQRIAMNAGRGQIWTHVQRDKRLIGYARVSRSGTPCGFCAMLISRGPVYKSEQSATFNEGDLYHDNCNCYAVPVYTDEQYEQGEMFALNRQYHKEWPVVTSGYSGKAALSVWRRYIREQNKSRPGGGDDSTAQEA